MITKQMRGEMIETMCIIFQRPEGDPGGGTEHWLRGVDGGAGVVQLPHHEQDDEPEHDEVLQHDGGGGRAGGPRGHITSGRGAALCASIRIR